MAFAEDLGAIDFDARQQSQAVIVALFRYRAAVRLDDNGFVRTILRIRGADLRTVRPCLRDDSAGSVERLDRRLKTFAGDDRALEIPVFRRSGSNSSIFQVPTA